MKGLTDKQKHMMEFIEEFMNSTGMAPTIYEIAEHFNIKTSTVFAHIRALQKKNFLTRSSKARSISLNRPKRKNRMPSGAQSIPVIDATGIPSKDLICDSKVFHKLAAGGHDLFAMHIKDSGLKEKGILNGDIIIMKSHPVSLSSGDIILTELDGHDVLRTCRAIDGDRIEVQDGTGSMMYADQKNFPVKGVVIGLQRSI